MESKKNILAIVAVLLLKPYKELGPLIWLAIPLFKRSNTLLDERDHVSRYITCK
jgi:hypothetical protein